MWLINPRWVFWHQVESPHITESLKAFKHHYGMLNTLNLNLAKLRAHSAPRANELEKIGIELHQQIQGIKSASLTAQQHFKLDFTVLINF
ncbi:MAG TPA: hypothetical protein VGP45_05320, partial [Marinobacter sp.]|nr:hypothetical protein [Marinobacter sp.]